MLKKIVSVCMIVVGSVFIVFGVVNYFMKPESMVDEPVEVKSNYQKFRLDASDLTFGADNFSVSSATFGADFYTYIYKGVVKAVSALDTISAQLSLSSLADQAIYDGIGKTLESQNESNELLQSNLKAVSQLSRISYETGIKQIEQSKNMNSIIMLGIGFAILFYGLMHLSEISIKMKKASLLSTEPTSLAPQEVDNLHNISVADTGHE